MQAQPPEAVDTGFIRAIETLPESDTRGELQATLRAAAGICGERLLELLDSQLQSRHLDLAARWLRARGTGYYTIAGFGHEGNAAVAAALRLDDPALLHYRSGGFYAERARMYCSERRDGVDPVRDVLLGMV